MSTWARRLLAGAAIALIVALVIGYTLIASMARSLSVDMAPMIGEMLLVHLAVCAAIEIVVALLL